MELLLSPAEVWRENLLGFLKALMLISSAGLIFLSLFVSPHSPLRLFTPTTTGTTALTSVAYTTLNYPNFGNNPTPLMTLPTTVNDMSQSITFLVDSGALITSIPLEYAQNTALDLTKLTRIILSSLTSQTVYGYITTASLDLGEHQITLPVTFAAIDTPVLGRQGFLDHYTLIFNHQDQTITIATNK